MSGRTYKTRRRNIERCETELIVLFLDVDILLKSVMTLINHIQKAAEVLHDADAVLITAGAGMGVDSGLPDFRGNEGFWKAYPPIAKRGISFYEMANPHWFDRLPRLAWAFYGHRLALYRRTTPHAGFQQLLEIGRNKPGSYFVFTSNVDGQFQKAGFGGRRIVECHGSIHHLQCVKPCCHAIWPADGIDISIDESAFEARDPLPACPHCGGLARPNVLMFSDWHWISDRTDEQDNRLDAWLQTIVSRGWELAIVEIGAGEAVATVRFTSERIAQHYQATIIRINPRDYHVPTGHISIPVGAAEGIQQIIGQMS